VWSPHTSPQGLVQKSARASEIGEESRTPGMIDLEQDATVWPGLHLALLDGADMHRREVAPGFDYGYSG